MSTVIVTVGPQHIGKSTFCKKVIELDSRIQLVSRDQILMGLFGSAYLDSYSGGHLVALEKMWGLLDENLQKENPIIILDCWNGPDPERVEIIKKLRERNVQKIGAWYFKTPRDICLTWRREKIITEKNCRNEEWEKRRRIGQENDFLQHYDFFYNNANVNTELGFDFVREINPLNQFEIKEIFDL